ncbi:phosphatidylinositol-specific phospholipase C domain-containing protein [Clostridium sp. ZS2-4]|uniref:phosphatidylinositol-specific phospholipase C domain-containing protein n=1 Tax=Clostridium sp. ZS2-4 TaxID=2987703 RepID=UPI00227B76A1|nr:phosphatidylinositol-specific phospholipase C domain-containing protein [Clostridium sp. ZS2-4]MCY6356876.1 hypothetical protein [Clostridium sp. ZS2-4]
MEHYLFSFLFCRSVHQHINFDDVLNACIPFLNNNPSEAIIMCIKPEHTSVGNTRTFEETFDYYRAKNPDKWLLTDTIPTLGKARGKIVLMRRFDAVNLPKGIDLTKWQDNTTFTIENAAKVKIQDQYKVPDNDEKWCKIEDMYNEANQNSGDWWYINHCSGYRPLAFGIPDIYGVAKEINSNMEKFFTANTSGKFGITVMDFATESRAKAIIATNNLN